MFLFKFFLSVLLTASLSTASKCSTKTLPCKQDSDCSYYKHLVPVHSDDDSHHMDFALTSNTFCEVRSRKCVCQVPGYNPDTCLPDLHGCSICGNENRDDVSNKNIGSMFSKNNETSPIYSCLNSLHLPLHHEIRVAGVFAALDLQKPIKVHLRRCSKQASLTTTHGLVLILNSHAPAKWLISMDESDPYLMKHLKLTEIVVENAPEEAKPSEVELNGALQHIRIEHGIHITARMHDKQIKSLNALGFGNDVQHGNTAQLLENVYKMYGDYVYSFVGSVHTNEVEICVGVDQSEDSNPFFGRESTGHPFHNLSESLEAWWNNHSEHSVCDLKREKQEKCAVDRDCWMYKHMVPVERHHEKQYKYHYVDSVEVVESAGKSKVNNGVEIKEREHLEEEQHHHHHHHHHHLEKDLLSSQEEKEGEDHDDRINSAHCNLKSKKCECFFDGYNPKTCLPEMYGCSICSKTAGKKNGTNLVKFDQVGVVENKDVYACKNMHEPVALEIRAVGIFASSDGNGKRSEHHHRRRRLKTLAMKKDKRIVDNDEQIKKRGGVVNVTLERCDKKHDVDTKVVLLLNSFEGVHWRIMVDESDAYLVKKLKLSEIYIESFEDYATTFELVGSLTNQIYVEHGVYVGGPHFNKPVLHSIGYGNDKYGGQTAQLLYEIPHIFGDEAYSFLGTFETKTVRVCVGGEKREKEKNGKNETRYWVENGRKQDAEKEKWIMSQSKQVVIYMIGMMILGIISFCLLVLVCRIMCRHHQKSAMLDYNHVEREESRRGEEHLSPTDVLESRVAKLNGDCELVVSDDPETPQEPTSGHTPS